MPKQIILTFKRDALLKWKESSWPRRAWWVSRENFRIYIGVFRILDLTLLSQSFLFSINFAHILLFSWSIWAPFMACSVLVLLSIPQELTENVIMLKAWSPFHSKMPIVLEHYGAFCYKKDHISCCFGIKNKHKNINKKGGWESEMDWVLP